MHSDLISTLQKNKLFAGIPYENLSFVSLSAEQVPVNEGKILFRKGDPVEFVFLLQHGEINHFIETERGGSRVVLYQDNDFIIPSDYQNVKTYNSTTVAVRDTILLRIPLTTFEEFLEVHPIISSTLYEYFKSREGIDYEHPSYTTTVDENSDEQSVPENSETEIKESEEKPIPEEEAAAATKMPERNEDVEIPEEKKEEVRLDSVVNDIDVSQIPEIIELTTNLSLTSFGGTVIVTVNLEDATFSSAAEIKKLLAYLIDHKMTNIIVDLSTAQMIDSTFLGALVVSLKKCTTAKGRFVLVGSNKPAWMIFEMTGLANVFTSYETLDEAKASFD